MKMKVLFHDSCFDGHASAAIFARFYREKIRPDATFEYVGVQHKAGGEGVDDALFTGDENAIVDFRYSQNPKLTWWFDHHQSAFQQAGDEAHFKADKSGKKFHDPHRKSCTRYLADIAKDKFGWDPKPMDELIYWGEIVDGALFTSPTMAVELKEPALQLMTVLEANRDPKFSDRIINELQTMPMSQVVAQDYVQKPLKPLLDKHRAAIELVRKKIRIDDGIVHFDLGDEGMDSINKFISYYLYPEARYTVWVGRSDKRAKVSIGSNPWHPELRKHDLSKIAERYGGGGHPVVAAISFKSEELERARKAAAEIRAELSR
ncbi:MAG: DHHA1 domain-containing protein [Myxococcaceae bacterium]